MCDDGGHGKVATTVDAARTRPPRCNDDEDAAAARTQRQERNGNEDTAVTEGGDGGQICALGGAEGRFGRMEGRRADLRVWRGGGQICDERRTTRGWKIRGRRGAEEVSDDGEEGGDGGGYEYSGGRTLGGGS
ncbi:hypothetical protein LR48_Vigan08g045400 [Vigna angularis]|uniref:Uncharacterized protein n=1 Tax=Phaseolus angularis TaxID=3914 RepID=A0A0L9V3X8_PHAAN|nr:hypothetical protein LR48_Vigan08g045400 [Vigna angularis]